MNASGWRVLVVHHQLQEPLGLRQRDRHVAAVFVGGGIGPQRQAHVEPSRLVERAAAFDEGFSASWRAGYQASTARHTVSGAHRELDGRRSRRRKKYRAMPLPASAIDKLSDHSGAYVICVICLECRHEREIDPRSWLTSWAGT